MQDSYAEITVVYEDGTVAADTEVDVYDEIGAKALADDISTEPLYFGDDRRKRDGTLCVGLF